MSTFLFNKIIFGPVRSRRLGISLGINLLPNECKVCTFNCIYCECGWTDEKQDKDSEFHDKNIVIELLDKKLKQLNALHQKIDKITFAGNGEPTLHPDFSYIIDQTILLRNKYCPKAEIAVLSNGTMIGDKEVFKALQKIEYNIIKLDTGFSSTHRILNNPIIETDYHTIVDYVSKFKGNVVIQSLFVKGYYNNQPIDNSNENEVAEWLKIINIVRPKEVMIYTIDRATPLNTLQKVEPERLDDIARKVRDMGIKAVVSY